MHILGVQILFKLVYPFCKIVCWFCPVQSIPWRSSAWNKPKNMLRQIVQANQFWLGINVICLDNPVDFF